MITNSRDKDLPTKQEAPETSSRLWPGLKNPRIVRVSRAFGGKDRHSKVSTIRGLRDRRVRLSVPTAIQLYDLQDRLGVNQPSKVVDWLLNAAHQEIDKLPPLQLPPGNLVQYIPQSLSQYSHHESAALSQNPSHPLVPENFEYMNEHEHEHEHEPPRVTTLPQSTNYWSSDVIPQRSKHHREDQEDGHTDEKGNTINGSNADVLTKLAGPSLVPYSSYYHWEAPTNAYLSQFGIRPSEAPPVPDTQIVLCPQGPTSSMFPSYFSEHFIQTQTANSAQSNSAKNSLHFGGTPVRPFQ